MEQSALGSGAPGPELMPGMMDTILNLGSTMRLLRALRRRQTTEVCIRLLQKVYPNVFRCVVEVENPILKNSSMK